MYYAYCVNPKGHVSPLFMSDICGYSGPEDLRKLLNLAKKHHAEFQFMTHEIIELGGPTPEEPRSLIYRWKRRRHPQEETIPLEQGPEFYDWLRDCRRRVLHRLQRAHEAYQAEVQERRGRSNEVFSRPF